MISNPLTLPVQIVAFLIRTGRVPGTYLSETVRSGNVGGGDGLSLRFEHRVRTEAWFGGKLVVFGGEIEENRE